MTSLRPDLVRDYLRASWRVLLKELTAFGLVGAAAFVIDIGLFTLLAAHGALKAKAVSTTVSTAFAYFGNRYLSFSHRARTGIRRETSFFFGINLIALIASELVLAFFIYALGYGHSSGVVFVVNLATIGLSTVFRFWAYKRFVFLHPDRLAAREPESRRYLDEELAE
ncbi:MAG TPA: GtrA family protein [Jatrophihabitans sp.]|nr:GtrA family protein [Jatrophihabitans sp.]